MKKILKIEPVLQRPRFGSQWYKVFFTDGTEEGWWSEAGSAGSLMPYEPAPDTWSLEKAKSSTLYRWIKEANEKYRRGIDKERGNG